MVLREQVPLASLTSFKTGGNATYVITASNVDEVRKALEFAKIKALPWYVLGEGSNVLAKDTGFEGVIILPRLEEIIWEEEHVTVGAGVSWDTFVREVAKRGLWGIENLAGIPGTVGASPIQNIGAYGVEVADTISFVEALQTTDGTVVRLTKGECEFSYRDSRFKRNPALVVIRVGFSFSHGATPRLSYADLARRKEAGDDLSSPSAIGDAVRKVRAGKFPDLRTHGTAGSFFKNPTISEQAFAVLSQRYPALPRYDVAEGVKIPLAFVLDRMLGLRGFRMGKAWLFQTQPLVLVLDEGGTANEVELLAETVVRKVKKETGIVIEREVQSLKIK